MKKPLNPPSIQSIKKGSRKGRANFLQNSHLPGIMEDIFSDLLPSLAPKKKKTPPDAHERYFSINKKRGAHT